MRILIILLLTFTLLLSFGCTTQADEITANLGQEVELKIGQMVSVEGEQIKVEFIEVIGDSRWATGATCIWQGEVTSKIKISYSGSLYTKTLIQPGLTQEPSRDAFKDYILIFDVMPYPELGKDIKPSEYYLKLQIEKKGLIEDINWFLRSYGEQGNLKDIIEGSEITVTFNSSNSQISGSAGCNIYGGKYELTDNTLSISDIYWTEMACLTPEGIMEQEQEFLTLLSSTQSSQADDTTLKIFCSGGQQLYFTTATR